MKLIDILSTHNIAANVSSLSKKAAIESVCKLATQGVSTITEKEALNALIEREKLGSTAIGYGVALPHARLEGLDKPLAALIHLLTPIPFDAPDDEPVDLLFALFIPEETIEEHLTILSDLAELFSIKNYREQLRAAKTDEEFYNIAIGLQGESS
jgi:PTS system nitrogen regulatory IIA component